MSNVQRELMDMGVGEHRMVAGHSVKRTPGGVWVVNGSYCPTLERAVAACGEPCSTN
jgi:hypothetical protein